MLTQPRFLGQLFRPNVKGICPLTFSLLLAACGGGGGGGSVAGGGIGGTGAVGTVSAIGSVTVNGVTYGCEDTVIKDDDGIVAQVSGDDCIAAEQAGRLSVGSVVVVTGSKDSSGNFSAKTVDASSLVSGPAINVLVTELSFFVLDQRILVDQTTRFEIDGSELTGSDGLTALAGQQPKTVEVSGFRNSTGDILATLVETKTIDLDERELKGFAVVNGNTVTVGGVSIILAPGQSPPENGACVEAKGIWTPGTLTLTGALKSDDDCDGGDLPDNLVKAEVEGVISGINAAQDQFNIGGQPVSAAGAVIDGGVKADLLNGVKVEAEGPIVNGTLVATKVQIKSNGVRIEGAADTALAGGSFTILGITVKVVTATDNDLDSPIIDGTRLRLEGTKSGVSQVTAAKISDPSSGGGETRTELRGPLDADPVSPNFTILGVPVQTSGATEFNGTSSASAASSFFANTKQNDIVKARGTEATNDVITADEVENED